MAETSSHSGNQSSVGMDPGRLYARTGGAALQQPYLATGNTLGGVESWTKIDEFPDPRVSAESFARDPFAVLKSESGALFDTFRGLSADVEKEQRLDSYFRRIESYDRAAFPDSRGVIRVGVPSGYIPDALVDLGQIESRNPAQRIVGEGKRPQNIVDTYGILNQHKGVMRHIFENLGPDKFPDTAMGRAHRAASIVSVIGQDTYYGVRYGQPEQTVPGGVLRVSEAVPAECQQYALTAQVLLQAAGIQSRLSKNRFATPADIEKRGVGTIGGPHVANVVTIPTPEGAMGDYLFDPTNPQLDKRDEWAVGLFRMGEAQQLLSNKWLVTEIQGGKRSYQEFPDMFWTIDRSTTL
jgi:hypothetical protein